MSTFYCSKFMVGREVSTTVACHLGPTVSVINYLTIVNSNPFKILFPVHSKAVNLFLKISI